MDDPEIELVLAAWRADQQYQQRSERTIAEREAFMRRYFERTHEYPLTMSAQSIKRFVSTSSRPGARIKPGTQWLYQQHFRAFCRWLVVTDQRVDNPMEKLPPISKPSGTPKPVTEQELGRLLAAAKGDTRVMVLLAAFAGLRVHEIAKIRGKDLDRSTWKLRVLGKRQKTAVLDLHPVLRDAVDNYSPTGLWFPVQDKEGKPTSEALTPIDVSTAIRKAMRAAGVDATAHQLRHRYGTVLLEQTGNIRTVQELMRHSSIASTQIYTQVTSQARADAIASMPVPDVSE